MIVKEMKTIHSIEEDAEEGRSGAIFFAPIEIMYDEDNAGSDEDK
jgi:hypothetical protein